MSVIKPSLDSGKNKRCTDANIALCERSTEYDQCLCTIFNGQEKALDTVTRDQLWTVLEDNEENVGKLSMDTSAVIILSKLSIVKTCMVLVTCPYSKRPHRQQTIWPIAEKQAEKEEKSCIYQSVTAWSS